MGDDALARGDVRKLNPGGDDAGDFRKREDAVAADDAKESVGEEKPCECGSWLACAGLAIEWTLDWHFLGKQCRAKSRYKCSGACLALRKLSFVREDSFIVIALFVYI